jgi:hypothetical protein
MTQQVSWENLNTASLGLSLRISNLLESIVVMLDLVNGFIAILNSLVGGEQSFVCECLDRGQAS